MNTNKLHARRPIASPAYLSRPAMRRIVAGAVLAGLSASALSFAAPAEADSSRVVTDLQVNLEHSRAKGHHDFLPTGGVAIRTEDNSSQSKAAGYFGVDVPLEDAGEPSLDWNTTTDSQEPGLQLVTDLDGNGSIDATLVGEPDSYGDDWWMPGKTIDEVPVAAEFSDAAPTEGGGGSAQSGSLEQWREAFPDAEVVQTGWSLGSGIQGSGTIESLELGDTTYTFAPAKRSTVSQPSARIDMSETRSKGHNEFSSRGVKVWTEDSSSESKAAGYFQVDTPLAQAGEPSWTMTDLGHAAVPGMQMVTDFDGDGVADGILVGEPGSYGNDWWLSNGSRQFVKDGAPSHVGGYGSENHGTLWQWRTAFPKAQVLAAGWSMGSGVQGDVLISDMTVGATTYRFASNHAPVAPAVSVSSVAGTTASIPLRATDADGDAITYRTSTPGATIVGSTMKVSLPSTFVGTRTITYTATDSAGASSTNTVQVRVSKASSKVTQAVPAKVAKGKRAHVKVAVKSTGSVRGGQVGVYLDGKLVRNAKVSSNGTATVSLGKVTKGKHRVATKFRGSDYAHGAWSTSAKLRVK